MELELIAEAVCLVQNAPALRRCERPWVAPGVAERRQGSEAWDHDVQELGHVVLGGHAVGDDVSSVERGYDSLRRLIRQPHAHTQQPLLGLDVEAEPRL